MTIFVTWQSRVTLDSIRNSCDVCVFFLLISNLDPIFPRQPDEVALGRASSPTRVEPRPRGEHRDEHPELARDLPQQVPRPEPGGRRWLEDIDIFRRELDYIDLYI